MRRKSKAMHQVIEEEQEAQQLVKRILAQDRQRVGQDQLVGVVKWYSHEKGYGFISQENGGPDVHVASWNVVTKDALLHGDTVVFQILEGTRGRTAVNVLRINRADYITEP